MIEFKDIKSKATCSLSDIQGFVFGGFNSRFWMLRKHINNLGPGYINNLPFFTWQCISLQLKGRDVDLIIKNEEQMMIFIKYLIFKLKSIDGRKDSAIPYLNDLHQKKIN